MESVYGVGMDVMPPYLYEQIQFLNLSNINERCSFLGIPYIITDSPEVVERLDGLDYTQEMQSGNIYLFKTPFTVFPDDLELISFSAKRIHVHTLSDGWHTIKVTYFPAWKAKTGDGVPVELEYDRGYMRFFADGGEDVIIEYTLLPVHYIGILVSALTLFFVAAVLIKSWKE